MTKALVPEPALADQYRRLLEPVEATRHRGLLIFLAVCFHALIFGIPLPAASVLPAPEPRKPTVVNIPHLPPPSKREHPQEPQARAPKRELKMPVPDRSPDEVEPVSDLTELVAALELPALDDFGFDDLKQADLVPVPTRGAVVVFQPLPVFPRGAPAEIREMRVEVLITVGADGRVKKVAYQSGLPIFKEAVLEAVRQWRYEPALAEGVPIEVTMSQRFVFRYE